jgi:hypothetical protein
MVSRNCPDCDCQKNVKCVGVSPIRWEDYIVVTISTGGINPAYGYLVYPDRRSNATATGELVIRSSVCPGLFKYATRE